MTSRPLYVPIFKGKEGEFAALDVLRQDIRSQIMPLIEVPSVPYDYATERPSKSLSDHVAGVADRLRRCFPDAPIYLDFPWFGQEEKFEDGRLAIEEVLKNVLAVPVVSRLSSLDYLSAVGRYSTSRDIGLCVRLLVEDFEEDVPIEIEVERMLRGVGIFDARKIDLLIDLEDLGFDAKRAVLVTRSIFSMVTALPQHGSWRRIILAAASFPEDLSEIDAARTVNLPRHEWDLWKTLQRKPQLLPRTDMLFGDYTISHPQPKELDPRVMRMSANVRYTTNDSWLIVKGRNVRQYGFSQYLDLCKELVQHPDYSGENYSWGDTYIAECAAGSTGPGNATTWRKVGVNHHITLVARQLSSFRLGT